MKTKVCPKCGFKVVRLGGAWNHTYRIEFCINPECNWTRKLYRVFPEHSEKDWKECKPITFLDEIVSEWQSFRQAHRNLPDEWIIATGLSIAHMDKAATLEIT